MERKLRLAIGSVAIAIVLAAWLLGGWHRSGQSLRRREAQVAQFRAARDGQVAEARSRPPATAPADNAAPAPGPSPSPSSARASEPWRTRAAASGRPRSPWSGARGDWDSPEMQRLREDAVAQRLGLTEAQLRELQPYQNRMEQQTRSIWANSSLSREQRWERLGQARRELNTRLNQLLTPAQREKQAEIDERRRQRRPRRWSNGRAGQPGQGRGGDFW